MKKRIFFGIVAIIAAFSIIGCKEDEEDPPPPEPFKLTVTGIPSSIDITGASLMAPTNPNIPIAIGINSNGTFTFYGPNETGRFPDSNKPFNTNGSYLVALAKANIQTFQEEKVWLYTQNSQPSPVEFSGNVTLEWKDFAEQQLP